MGPFCILGNLGMALGTRFSGCCPETRDRACKFSQVTSSIVFISLVGKRWKAGRWKLTGGFLNFVRSPGTQYFDTTAWPFRATLKLLTRSDRAKTKNER